MSEQKNSYEAFLQKVDLFKIYNWFFLVLTLAETGIYSSMIATDVACPQAMPLTIYTTICEFCTMFVPIICLVSAINMKYFNTSLIFVITMMIAKVIQMASLWFFTRKQLGICMFPLSTRIPILIVAGIQLICMSIDGWLLRRIKRINRQMKVSKLIGTKKFLSDQSD